MAARLEMREVLEAAATPAAHVRATCEVRRVLLFGGEYRSSHRFVGVTR